MSRIGDATGCSLTPSIDFLMESAARVFEKDTVGIILSGMGRDGSKGMRAIKHRGGPTIVQDESSLIFGMPKAVIEAGLADQVLPASQIAGAVVRCVAKDTLAGSDHMDEALCLRA